MRPPPPSSRWLSNDGHVSHQTKERVALLLESLHKDALLDHAKLITGDQTFTMSNPFSTGKYWCCFEMTSSNGNLLIARVRLPRRAGDDCSKDLQSELYTIECEVSVMKLLKGSGITVPTVYAYEGPDSIWASKVGASYMLIEGFYGNTLRDTILSNKKSEINSSNVFEIVPILEDLPEDKLEHVLMQWTAIQAKLATFTFPYIGPVASINKYNEITTGPICADYAPRTSVYPLRDSWEFFRAISEARYQAALLKVDLNDPKALYCCLCTDLFRDIVSQTDIYKTSSSRYGPFHLNHMDMGAYNILVDENLNFLAIIDWEFAQFAPWEINFDRFAFSTTYSGLDVNKILHEPVGAGTDSGYTVDADAQRKRVQNQMLFQKLYRKCFAQAEEALKAEGNSFPSSYAKVMDSPASLIFRMLDTIYTLSDSADFVAREMVRLGYGLEGKEADLHIQAAMQRMVRRIAS